MDPKDSIPAVPAIAKSWWHARIAKWLDVRSFLWQRHQILRRPACIFESHENEPRWKKSYDFAVSSSMLALIIIGLVASLASFFLREPSLTSPLAALRPSTQRLLTAGEKAKASVEHSHQRFYKDPGDGTVYSRAQELDNLNQQISIAKQQLRAEEVTPTFFNPPLWVILLFIGATPLAVYVMVEVFRFLFRAMGGGQSEKASFAPQAFLYCYSASMFWPFTASVVCIFLWWEFGKYLILPALLNGSDETSYLMIGSFS